MASLFPFRWLPIALLLACAAADAPRATAQEQKRMPGGNLREDTSLQFIPADAAFYRACLRNREQLDALLNSNALRRLAEAPRMSEWLAALKARWADPNRSLVGKWLEDPRNRELANFAGDALSQEIFWYGDASTADLLDLTAYVNDAAATAQLNSLRSGKSLAESERAAAHAALGILAQDPKQLRVPATVVGFKVTDRERAARQIVRLEEMLRAFFADNANFAEQLRREQIAGSEFLSWRFDGSMLPWNLVPKSELNQVDPELRRRFENVLRSKKAVLSIGLRGDYLLVSLGENNEHLARLGQPPFLIDRPELAPLAGFADRPINAVAYISQEYRDRSAAANEHQLQGAFFFDEFLKHPEAFGEGARQALDEQTRGELAADMKAFASELAASAWSKSATLRFSFLTERGYEGYCYDWSGDETLDQPLTVLNHLDGEPLGFFAIRSPLTLEDYDRSVKWLRRGRYYFEKIALQGFSEEQRTAYQDASRDLHPVLEHLDRVNRELLIPAMQDGQKAVVLGATPQPSTEFVAEGDHSDTSAVDNPRPGFELACVVGLSDAAKFKEGCEEYVSAAEQVWSRVRNVIEGVRAQVRQTRAQVNAPRIRLPELPLPSADALRPLVESVPGGELYYYRIPALDNRPRRVAPNMAVSDRFAVFSYLPDYSLRLLEEKPLHGEGVLAEADRPLYAAGYLDVAGIIDAVQPWLERASERRQERLIQRQESRAAAPTPARTTESSTAPAPYSPPAAAPQSRAPQPRAPQPRAPHAVIPQPPSAGPVPRAPVAQAPSQHVPPAPPPTVGVPAARVPDNTIGQPPITNQSAPEQRAGNSRKPISPTEAKEQMRFLLGLLRCWQGFAAATYHEDGATVTHYEIRFADLSE